MRRSLAFVFLLAASVAQAQGPDLYFTVEAVEVARVNAPALHSGAAAQHGGRWLFVAGRTNGLHTIVGPGPSFPPAEAHDAVVVYDPTADAVWSAPLASLPEAVRDPLQAVNVQFLQEGETLYVAGGYGFSTAAGDFVTFGTLTALDVPGLMDAVVNGTALAPHVRQLTDDRLRVTGGYLVRLGSRYYLAGGQRFDGEYAFVPTPGQQAYTEALRSFEIVDDGSALGLAAYAEAVDPGRLHRRDGNIGPVIRPDGSAAFALYGGVFRTDAVLPYRTPVLFDGDGLEEQPFEARFGHYTTALLPLHDTTHGTMHTVFFGGMGQFYCDGTGIVVQDNLVPFIRDVSVLSFGDDGAVGEALLDPLPDRLGTNSYVFLDPAVPANEYGVIALDALAGRTRVGFFAGGIAADAANPGFMPATGTTWASSRLFALYLTPLVNPATEDGPDPSGFTVTLAGPNPFRERTRLAVTLDATAEVTVEVFDAVGRRVALLHDGPLAAGPHVFDVDGGRLPSGVYLARVTGARGTASEQLVRLR